MNPSHLPSPPVRPSLLRSRRTACSLLFTGMLMGLVLTTDVAAPPDEAGVQRAVAQQLRAFAAEDAGRAFALADDRLRTEFGNAEAFLETVRDRYPMVLDPASVFFLKPHSDGRMALQKVRLTDSQGMAWLLTYLLEREGGEWMISATVVEPDGIRILV